MVMCGLHRPVNIEIASVCCTDKLTGSRCYLSDVDSCWTWPTFIVVMNEEEKYRQGKVKELLLLRESVQALLIVLELKNTNMRLFRR